MQNRFIKNIIFLLFINILVKPFWIFGIDLEVQNLLGNVTYGTFFAINNFAYLFYIVLDFGLTNYNNRNVAQNNELLSKHFIGISQVKILLGLIYFGLIFLIAGIKGYEPEELKLLFWTGLNWVLLSFILYLRSNISALLLFKTDSFLSVFDRLLSIIICGFLLWSGVFPRSSFNIFWYVYSQTAAYVMTLILALTIVLRHTKKLSFKLNIQFTLDIIKRSLPYALLVLLMSFYNRLEPVLLHSLLPVADAASQTGIYAQSFRILDAGNNISYLFSVILLPLFAAMIKQGEGLDTLIKQAFNLLITFIGIGAILCVVYSKSIMAFLYPIQSYETALQFSSRIGEASLIFQILMGSFISVSVTYIFGTLLTANGNLKYLNIVAAGGVLINVLLNLILIPHFRAEGAAFTSFATQLITASIQYFIAKKIFNFNFGHRYWTTLIIFFVLVLGVSWLVKLLPVSWIYQFAISLVISLVMAFITRTLSLKDCLTLIESAKSYIVKK